MFRFRRFVYFFPVALNNVFGFEETTRWIPRKFSTILLRQLRGLLEHWGYHVQRSYYLVKYYVSKWCLKYQIFKRHSIILLIFAIKLWLNFICYEYSYIIYIYYHLLLPFIIFLSYNGAQLWIINYSLRVIHLHIQKAYVKLDCALVSCS